MTGFEPGSSGSEATALPTVPQPLPNWFVAANVVANLLNIKDKVLTD